MLNIQVKGKGMIPRGYGLAPRLEPFPADRTLIATIMSTPGLEVYMIHPENKHAIKLTNQNFRRMWDSFSDYTPEKKLNTPVTAPSIPATKTYYETKPAKPEIEAPVQSEKKNEPVPVVIPSGNDKDKKDDYSSKPEQKPADNSKPGNFKPINADDPKKK